MERVARVPAFHLCDTGLISGLAAVICELSLFLMLFSLNMPQGFFSRFSGFPPSPKINNMQRRVKNSKRWGSECESISRIATIWMKCRKYLY